MNHIAADRSSDPDVTIFTVDIEGLPVRFVALMASGDSLAVGALDRVRSVVRSNRDIDIVYGDSMLVGPDGSERIELRPAWSPDRLLDRYDLGSVLFVREHTVAGLTITGHHQLALIAGEEARTIVHIPEVLSVRHGEPFVDIDADTVSAVLAARHARITTADVGVGAGSDGGVDGTNLAPADGALPFVSIVMLTGGARRMIDGIDVLLVANAVSSILVATDRRDFEIVIVIDQNTDSVLGDRLRSLDPERIVIVRDDKPFNFSAANNLGVRSAKGEHLVFVNDDCEVRSTDWLSRLSMHLTNSGVGVVGARLLYGDGRVQHAGLVARDGYVEHRFGGYPNDARSQPAMIENVSAVTGACLAITRSLFDELEGFPESFPLNFNDVHLCFAAADAGRRVVLDHRIVLTHHETSSREAGITEDEQARFEARWPERSATDPYDHPNHLPVRAQPIAPPAALLRLRAALGLEAPAPRLSA